ncbi:hypothetical protein EYD10_01268 [Varanus komodoensis]|nr:hypothetical protein EYD10_01268 [Varanus komodoensis]
MAEAGSGSGDDDNNPSRGARSRPFVAPSAHNGAHGGVRRPSSQEGRARAGDGDGGRGGEGDEEAGPSENAEEANETTRRLLRQQYRELISNVLQNREMMLSTGNDKLTEALEDANKLFTGVSRAREAALDAQFLVLASNLGKEKANQLQSDMTVFDSSAFAEDLSQLLSCVIRAIGTIAPKRPLPPGRARSSPWYTPELRAMKQVGRRLEHRWRRSRGESDQTHLRAHYRAYAVVVRMAKKKFFSASIASSQCRPVELFRVVQGLIHPGPKKDLVPPSKARCDNFARHFREKIAQIRHELDSTIEPDSTEEMPTTPSSPQLMDEFQLLWPDDVDKVLGQVRPTTCLLDPCPSWLLKKAKDGIGTWILEVVNASLRDGRVLSSLKEAVVRPVLKKASLDPEVAANYRPVANIPFLGKVLERVVAGQLQAFLDETDYLDPFQSGFRPGYGAESALVALYDDLCRERDRGSASLLVLLDLSAAFHTIDHGILNRLAGLGVGGTAWRWFRSYLSG